MAATGRYRLPPRPVLDNWSTREKLALACSVMRSGDQNWVSVSRAIRAYAETERPENWFSQKNCALQYSDLLEKVETPKRKRGEKEKEASHVETPGTTIVSRLTVDRLEELQALVRDAQDQYMKLKEEVETIRAGHHDDKLQEMWAEMQPAKPPAPEPVPTTSAPEQSTPVTEPTNTQVTEIIPDVDAISPLPVLPQDVLDAALELPNLSDLLQKSPPDNNALSSMDVTAMLGDSIKDEPVDVEVVDPVDTVPDIKVEVDTSTENSTPSVSTETAAALPDKPSENAPERNPTTDPVPSVSIKTEELPTEPNIKEEPKEESKEEPVPSTPAQVKDRKKEEKSEEDDKDWTADGFPDTPAAVELDDAPPSSPSSIISGDTDGGSSTRGKGYRGGRSRGGRSRGRSSQRGSRSSRRPTEEDKDVDLSSKAESSDDDEESKNEESDTASTAPHVRSTVSAESMPNSPASTLGPMFASEEEEKAHKIWKKSIMLVWRAAANHKYANVFLHPVTEDIAPGYHSVVHKPMNLMTIKRTMESGQIRVTAEFQRDMMLMFSNAIMYNNSDHDVFNMATEMYDDVMHHIEQYVLTQQMISKETPKSGRHRRSDVVTTAEAGPPPESGGKLTRGSRRSETATPGGGSDKSDKEDDRKRRISMDTSDQSHGGKAKKRKA